MRGSACAFLLKKEQSRPSGRRLKAAAMEMRNAGPARHRPPSPKEVGEVGEALLDVVLRHQNFMSPPMRVYKSIDQLSEHREPGVELVVGRGSTLICCAVAGGGCHSCSPASALDGLVAAEMVLCARARSRPGSSESSTASIRQWLEERLMAGAVMLPRPPALFASGEVMQRHHRRSALLYHEQ